MLLEREAELAAVDELLGRAADGEGATLVLEGPAGIGKTALLSAFAARAAERGFRVLRARGGELETAYPFGVARQLLDGAIASDDLTPSAGKAGEDELAARLYRLSFAVADLADGAPLLLCIDDAHWADEPSRRLLRYLALRADGMRAALAVATRPEHAPLEADRLAAEAGARILRPRPLSAEAVGSVLDDRPRAEVEATVKTTGGNPFLVVEIAAALRSGESAAQLFAADGAAMPERVRRWTALRIGRLGHDASRLAQAVAILGDGVDVSTAAAVAELSIGAALEAVAVLDRAELMHGGTRPGFAHPLLRSAVVQDLGAPAAAALHVRAVEHLLASGAPPQLVANHALLAPPLGDPRVVAALRDTAAAASAVGDDHVALELLERAVAEGAVPDVDKPRLALELGRARLRTGDSAGAVQDMRRARDAVGDDAERGEIVLALADALARSEGTAAGVRLLDAEAAAVGDEELSMRMRAEATWMSSVDQELAAQLPARVAGATELEGRTAGERALLSLAVTLLVYTPGTRAADVVPVAVRALGDGALARETAPDSMVHLVPNYILLWCGALAEIEPAIELLIAAGEREGRAKTAGYGLHLRGLQRLGQGRVRDAEADLAGSLQAFAQVAGDQVIANLVSLSVRGALAEARLHVRGPEAALAVLEEGGLCGDIPLTTSAVAALLARAQIHLALGRPADALADLEMLERFEAASGFRSPHLAATPWKALAHHGVGDAAAARAAARKAFAQAEAWATPVVLGRALRVRGLVAGRREGLDDLRAAVDVLRTGPDATATALALADLGRALRRLSQRREARAAMEEALDLAHHNGAQALAAELLAELRVLGARPRRLAFSGLDSITAAERRVAELAAEGLTNRQIAQRLFLTLKTVETHLRSTYRKLDIGSRAELGDALAAKS